VSPPAFRDAVLSQPANLRDAATSFCEAVQDADISRLSEGTLVLSGIGASAHALIPAVLALRAAGRRAFAVSSAELRGACAARLADAYVLVSQSGASAETVQALESLDGAPLVAISAQGASPLAQAADLWLPLGPRPDTPVATLSYTATLQALGMLCDLLTGNRRHRSGEWERLPDLAAELLERSDLIAEQLAPGFARIHALDAVGAGPAAASAGETALLAREALKLPAAGMETREYLHGPLEPVGDGFGCVVFGAAREHALARSLAGYGATTLLISAAAAEQPSGATAIELADVSDLAAPVLQILPVQLLIEKVARLRGLTIGPLTRHQDDTKVAP
jgi:glucosamine--fructose-6-phosphate aminotransferase (isomerizing)